MRLFVGYGYNDRDLWVEKLVFPLLIALGCEVVEGKVMYGDSLGPEIKDAVLSCEALIGFTTRREQIGDRWTTHRWVIEELAVAWGNQIPVVEVREEGIDAQLGMLDDGQFIVYNEARRDICIVNIAQAICRIRQRASHTIFKLEPSEFKTYFRTLLNRTGLRCSYRVMRRNVESELRQTRMWPVAGGLAISVDGLRAGDLIQVCVAYGEQSWTSDYEPIDAIRIALSRES
jgi:hypothetical protein